jgi:hypothetical protein
MRVIWGNRDLGENLFHDIIHKIISSLTGLSIKDVNNSNFKNIKRIELAQEEG